MAGGVNNLGGQIPAHFEPPSYMLKLEWYAYLGNPAGKRKKWRDRKHRIDENIVVTVVTELSAAGMLYDPWMNELTGDTVKDFQVLSSPAVFLCCLSRTRAFFCCIWWCNFFNKHQIELRLSVQSSLKDSLGEAGANGQRDRRQKAFRCLWRWVGWKTCGIHSIIVDR